MAKTNKGLPSQKVNGRAEAERVNKYFLTVSERYRIAKYITILVLALFVAVMMIAFRSEITYSNLMYLLRDFNTGEAEYSGGFDPVKYDEQENMSFALYRDELAVAGNRTLRMYNTKGTESRKYELGYTDPILAASEKYLIAYDLCDTSYSVFTSVAKTHSGDAVGEIEDCAVNDSGEYVLLCKSTETKYVVCSYDASFRECAKYFKNKYVTSVDIGKNGQILIVSVTPGNDDVVLESELYLKGQESAAASYSLSGAFPIDCGFGDDGGFYVLCTDRVLFFDSNGSLLSESKISEEMSSYSFDGEKLVLSAKDDTFLTKTSLFLFDMAGELLYNNKIDGNVTSVTLTENEIYALSPEYLTMIPYEGGDIQTVPADEGGITLLSTGGSAVFCGRFGASSVIIGETDSSETTAFVSDN